MPPRAKDVVRALATFGVTVEKSKGGSSHYKASKAGYRSYPLALHNGMKSELSDVYVKGVCQAFDIDEEDLRALL